MAELLVKSVSATHPDPGKDARGCYKQLDPVVAMPDGHAWGSEELNTAKFWVVKITGATVEDLRPYLRSLTDGALNTTRRRAYTCALNLTPQVLNALNAGPVTYTWTQARKFITHKLSGLTAEQGG